MWPWIKRWHDWLMNDLWPTYRIGFQPQALHFSYEKAGLVVHDQPVPWNAETLLIEANLRLPMAVMRRKNDFHLQQGEGEPIGADSLRKLENEDRYCVRFRLPPPSTATTYDLSWRTRAMGQIVIPTLPRDEFLDQLKLQMPTLLVRLGQESVACQTFVSNQCRGLLASAVLTSPTSLAPLADMDLHVEFRCERSGTTQLVPVRLSSSQMVSRQALITVVPRKYPRHLGTWTATWRVGDRVLASQRVTGISQRHFERSLRISDSRFVLQSDKGEVQLARQVPPGERSGRVGPCFLIASSEAAMAGLCTLQVSAQVPGAVQPPLLLEQEVLITDGPTMVAPGTLDANDLEQVTGFEVTLKGKSLGLLPLCPAPSAAFNAEGGFKPPPEYTWSPAAEEEMLERLNRLLDARGGRQD